MADFVATVAVGDKSFEMPMTRIGDPSQEASYRWTAMGTKPFGIISDAAQAISASRSLTFSDNEGSEEFPRAGWANLNSPINGFPA